MTMSTPEMARDVRLRGIAAAPGIALGPAFVYRVGHEAPPVRHLAAEETPDAECARLDAALAAVRADLLRLKKESPGTVGSALAKIFDAQVMIVDDPAICAQVKDAITTQRLGAESAFDRVVGEAQQAIERSPDQYLREMANDIEAVKMRVINQLMGHGISAEHHPSSPSVILANTITPADIMSLSKGLVLGVVTQTGGQTSHTALLAKSLGIPAVSGLDFDMRSVRPATTLVVDGFSGVVILNPAPHTIEFFERKKKRTHSPWSKKLDALRDLPAVTTDRHRIAILANIDLAAETELALAAGAGGVGLYRTEYLFLQKGGYPPEARQVEVYRQAIAGLRGRPLVVRTFDLGSDKAAPDAPPEANPALGVRGIRLSLEKPATLLAQLRALLTASAAGPIWVMVPMIATVEEFDQVRALWSRAKQELRARKVPFDAATKLGLMVETPAAVQVADELAARADFFSVGTNDLVQYTTAVDRGNHRLHALQHYWHPSLWRQLAQIVRAGHKARIPVGICGEMSGDPKAVLPLLGIGFDSLSFHPNSIPRVKALVRAASYAQCRQSVTRILAASTADQIRKVVTSLHDKTARAIRA
jgi:phosphotransferase system enzyme I (PtsI)